MKITRIVVATVFSALSVSCFASKVDFNLYGGLAFANLSNNSSVQINDVVDNYYQPHSPHTTEPIYGIGIGHTFENMFHQPINVSIGISGYYTDFNKVTGTEYPFVNAGSFDTLNYQFGVISTSAMLEPRLVYSKYAWQPYLLAGVGIAWNRLDNYEEEATNPGSSAAPAQFYQSNTNSSFAYEVGVGIQHVIFHDEQHKVDYFVSVDYRYMNFGEGRLTNFPAMTSNDHLGVSNISVQALMLSLRASIF